jgi:hypothetical protein|tara:strand:+ start:493 stop:687 length:195 start_codon:yes stop_codon:yes gene_type:complete
MTLKQIYFRAKKINPLYKGTFADFILDFLNCRECFFISFKEWREYAFTPKIEKALDKHFKRYYS